MVHLVDAEQQRLIPKRRPLGAIVRRWASWGWSVEDACRGQPSSSQARRALVAWLNDPPVKAAFLSAAGQAYDPGARVLPWWAGRFRKVGDDVPAPPAPTKRYRVSDYNRAVIKAQAEKAMKARYALIALGRHIGMTLDVLSSAFGVSKARVSQIEAKAGRKFFGTGLDVLRYDVRVNADQPDRDGLPPTLSAYVRTDREAEVLMRALAAAGYGSVGSCSGPTPHPDPEVG